MRHFEKERKTEAMISLRPLRHSDIVAVNRWPPYQDAYAQMDYALRADGGWLYEYGLKPDCCCYMAEANGESVGFVLLITTHAKRAELRIALHPEKTGHGLGRQVMAALMETGFFELGLETIHLIVRKNNFPAMRLYENLGFSGCGECTLIIQGRPVEFFKMEIQKEEFHNPTRKEGQP